MPKPFQHLDKYALQAQRDGYRARSAYKLLDILNKFKAIKVRGSVLDLGCAPGSWLQVLAKQRPRRLVGVDLQQVKPIAGATLLRGDIFSDEITAQLRALAPFDLITSDMAPKTTGRPDNDQWHSVELCQQVLDLARDGLLRPQGSLICKIFVGADFQEFWAEFKRHFQRAKCFKPPSCRDRSVETFVVGQEFL